MVDYGNEQHAMSIRQPMTTNAVYQYPEDGIPIRPVGIFNHNALHEVNLTGAGEVEVMKGPSSSLYGSNAYDKIEYDFTNNLVPSPTTGAPSETRSFDHTSPKPGATWSLSNATSLYANYSQGFTPPEVSALYARLTVPNLEPATFDYEANALRSARSGRLGLPFLESWLQKQGGTH